MKNYIVIFKGTNKKLALLELEILWKLYFNEELKLKEIQNTGYYFKSNIINIINKFLNRLTYTNYIGEVVSNGKSIEDICNNFTYNKKIKSYVLRIKKLRRKYDTKLNEKEIAEKIWNKLNKPKVDLLNAKAHFNLVPVEDKNEFYLCERIFENDKDYLRRMPIKRPIKMPYTLKSDMARVSINYLNLKKGIILDPFCGIGGILLEAYDMNFEVIGNDISWNDLKYFRENFKFFFPKNSAKVTLADCKNQFLKTNSVDGIVTDIPYGKSSRKIGIDLYENFLKNSKKMLKKNRRIIVIYANFIEFRELANKYFNEIEQIDEYINRSMTRHILILENSK